MADRPSDRQSRGPGGEGSPQGRWGWLQPWRGQAGNAAPPIVVPDRRSGVDRRSAASSQRDRLEEMRRRAQRRAHVRQPMPFGGVAPSGRICAEGQACVHADLVDLSEGGICVLLTHPLVLSIGDHLELTLHENFGTGSLKLDLEVRWLVETPLGLRVGGRFLDPQFRPSATFLKTYIETDFGGQRGQQP